MSGHLPARRPPGPATDGRPSRLPANPLGPSGLLALQRLAGNAAVAALVGSRPVTVQRNGTDVTKVVTGVTEASDITSLAVQLPMWGVDKIRPVAAHLGVDRFKDLIFALGSDVVAKGSPEKLATARTLDQVADAVPGATDATIQALARRWKSPLTEILFVKINRFVPSIDTLKPLIQGAPKGEREAASRDSTLLAVAKSKLGPDDYLGLLPALAVFNPPTTMLSEARGKWMSHIPGDEADRYIRARLTKETAAAVKAGRQVEGEVSVVGDADFNQAFVRNWGTGISPSVCNAFVDVYLPKRHIWVHKDRGNSGTVIHEGMHKYADPTLRNELIAKYPGAMPVSQLDEGITEYFTRIVTDPLGIVRANYQEPWRAATRLAAVVGRDVVAAAYYDGAFDALKDKWVAAGRRTRSDWEDLAKAIEGQNWTLAMASL